MRCNMDKTNHQRRGHSMMEMVVVMSVLAGIAALSWPMLKSPMEKHRLHAAAQEVSAAMAKARLKAMQSGEAQVFRVQLHTGKFQVIALSSEETTPNDDENPTEPVVADSGDMDPSEHSPMNEVADQLSEESELPGGICFEIPGDDDDDAPELAKASEATEDEWMDFAVFYPDGGTCNAVMGLHGAADFHVDLKLSGLTGVVRIGETRRQELR